MNSPCDDLRKPEFDFPSPYYQPSFWRDTI